MAFDNCCWVMVLMPVHLSGFEMLSATVPPPAVNVSGWCRHTCLRTGRGFLLFGRNMRTYEMAPKYSIVCNITMGMISCDNNCDRTVRRCWVGVVYSERKLARVFFIDHGEWVDIPLQRLFWLPEFVTAFPLQVLPCVIPGWLQREEGKWRLLLCLLYVL